MKQTALAHADTTVKACLASVCFEKAGATTKAENRRHLQLLHVDVLLFFIFQLLRLTNRSPEAIDSKQAIDLAKTLTKPVWYLQLFHIFSLQH
jgi:uncharacterized protein YhhL (DUF1145 family)